MFRAISGTTLALATVAFLAFTFPPDLEPPAPAGEAVSSDEPVSTYTIDRAHSFVGFRIRHLGISNVTGSFSNYDATVRLAGDDLSTFGAEATINVASINTENERRDNHLRSGDFFEVEQFPTMRFVSTGVRNVAGDRFEVEGDLTIRGVTRPVVLQAERIGAAQGPDGSYRIGIEARTTVDRHDFGLTWNRLTEAGGVVAAREVTITLDMQVIRVES